MQNSLKLVLALSLTAVSFSSAQAANAYTLLGSPIVGNGKGTEIAPPTSSVMAGPVASGAPAKTAQDVLADKKAGQTTGLTQTPNMTNLPAKPAQDAVALAQAKLAAAEAALVKAMAARDAALAARSGKKGEARAAAEKAADATGAAMITANAAMWTAKHELNAALKKVAGGGTKPTPPKADDENKIPDGAMVVSNTTELNQALAGLKNGDSATIVLRGGNYDYLLLKDKTYKSMTLMGMPNDFPIIKGMKVTNVQNLMLKRVQVTINTGVAAWSSLVKIERSKNITVQESLLKGPIDFLAPGSSIGVGLSISDTENFTVEKTTFRDLYIGAGFGRVKGLKVIANDIQELRKDGMDFVGVHDALIADNLIDKHNKQGDAATGDHPDHIQFWGKKDDEYSTNVMISGNRLLSPTAQGIFMRCYNDCPAHTYKNVTIKDNYITTNYSNGVVLTGGTNILVENNVVVSPAGSDRYSRIKATMKGVIIRNNVSNLFGIDKADIDETVFNGNKIVRKGFVPSNIPSLDRAFAGYDDVLFKVSKSTGDLVTTVK